MISPPDPQVQTRTSLDVCVRCRPPGWEGADGDRPGARFAAAIDAEIAARGFRGVGRRDLYCASQCKRPCVVAFAGDGKFAFLFGDLDPARDAAAVVDAFLLYRSRADGLIERAERPPVLRAGILGRIPPLGWQGPLVVASRPASPLDGAPS
jgi:predicted metal-binding protein